MNKENCALKLVDEIILITIDLLQVRMDELHQNIYVHIIYLKYSFVFQY